MTVMNFDLEDGLPPVSFSLKSDDCDRFMAFMAECQAIKEAQPKREWVGLTEYDRRLISFQWHDGNGTATEIIDLTETKLKEKNT